VAHFVLVHLGAQNGYQILAQEGFRIHFMRVGAGVGYPLKGCPPRDGYVQNQPPCVSGVQYRRFFCTFLPLTF
jgi:hypothetical protein